MKLLCEEYRKVYKDFVVNPKGMLGFGSYVLFSM